MQISLRSFARFVDPYDGFEGVDEHADVSTQELKEVKVLEEGGKLVEKKRRITLRMLLSHTGRVAVYVMPALVSC
jgi:hypothetical protein